ncbi:hypothetical protein MBLNU457_4857t1 [Dothideomycetes sp. NU457]
MDLTSVMDIREDLFTYVIDESNTGGYTKQISDDDLDSQCSESDDDSVIEGPTLDNPYGSQIHKLRPRRRTDVLFDAAWVDQDESGNYDPDASSELQPARRRRQSFRARCVGDEEEEARKVARKAEKKRRRLEAKEACLRRDHIGCPGVVTFKVKSSKLKQLVSAINTNWPPGACDIKIPHLGKIYLPDPGPDGERDRLAKKRTNKEDGRPDLTGHREARGCWGCFELGMKCSLISDFPQWPCETCAHDGHDCELITPPERKLPCEHCTSQKLTCPYTYLQDHTEPCRPCQSAGVKCVAGPVENGIRLRVSYDRDWKEYPAPKPKPKVLLPQACRRCETAGKDCSLLSELDNPHGCIICEMDGVQCELATSLQAREGAHRRDKSETRSHKGKKRERSSKRRDSAVHDIDSSKKRHHEHMDNIEPTTFSNPSKKKKLTSKTLPLLPRGVKIRRIVTKLCHPITFGGESNDPKKPCSFCTTASYAIFGLGEKHVSVRDSGPGKPFTEISGGHAEAGHPHTHICGDCTMSRFKIASCEHDLEPFRAAESAAMNINDAFSRMVENQADGSDIWCSLCPTLATHRCKTVGAMSGKGCGLVLCETCMVEMAGLYDCNLVEMLRDAKDEITDNRPFGYRADVEIMKPDDGALARYIETLK